MSMYFPFPFPFPLAWVVWVVLTDSRLCLSCVGGYVDIGDWELVCSCQVVLSWPEVGVVYRYDQRLYELDKRMDCDSDNWTLYNPLTAPD